MIRGRCRLPERGSLFPLKPLIRKLQCPAILSHRANDVVRRSRWNIGLNLQRNRHVRTNKPGEMRDDLFRNLAGVAAHAGSVQRDRAVEASGLSLQWYSRR